MFAAWTIDRVRYVHTADARIAADMVLLSAETDARVIRVEVKPGDTVRTGQVLLRLDDRVAQLELARLQAELAAMAADIERERRRARLLREAGASRVLARASSFDATAADVQAAQSLIVTAEADHARIARLFDTGVVTRPRMEQAADRLETARQQLAVARAAQRQRASEVQEAVAESSEPDLVEVQIDALVHAAAAMRHRIAHQQVVVERHVVLAPGPGVIDETFVEAGERAATGARLVLMHDPASIRIEASVKETDIRRVIRGAPVRLKFDAQADRLATGKVERIRDVAASQFALVPPANPAGVFTKITQRVPVRVAIDIANLPEGLVLRPGGMATLRIAAFAR